jgi:hypothetical protein
VGVTVGAVVGSAVGCAVGAADGVAVGVAVGDKFGAAVGFGFGVGIIVGTGACVGAAVVNGVGGGNTQRDGQNAIENVSNTANNAIATRRTPRVAYPGRKQQNLGNPHLRMHLFRYIALPVVAQ